MGDRPKPDRRYQKPQKKKISLTDRQSSLTNSILGFVSPFTCKSAMDWRKWGYLERAMLGEGAVACDGIFEWITDNSIQKLRINIKAESEYEEKPAPTEL